MSARRPPIFGPEPWATLAGRSWSHYDRWYAMVCDASFGGDLSRLRARLVEDVTSGALHRRDDARARLSHLADLEDRLAAAEVGVAELAGHEPADKATMTKARRKVLEQSLEWRAKTPAMRRPPSVVLAERARTGGWARFPGDPAGAYDAFAPLVEGSHLPLSPGMRRAREVEELLAALDQELPAADRLALYRGFHTAGLVLADRCDDSCGVIGELREEAWRTYLSLDRAGMAAEDYWQDLCELIVHEPYALAYTDPMLPFRHVHAGEAEMIESILLGLAEEYRSAWLEYQAEEATAAVAWLHVAGRRFGRYEATAGRLGSSNWQATVALAESAQRAGRHDLARAVYDAADQPGFHRELIRRKRAELDAAGSGVTLRLVR